MKAIHEQAPEDPEKKKKYEDAVKKISCAVIIENMTEKDEVVEIKKLFHDQKKKIMYFQILLRKQTEVHLGTLDYSEWK